MNLITYDGATSDFRRLAVPASRRSLPSVTETVLAQRPDEPMHCLRPAVLADSAEGFIARFPGDVLYAVKCNPEPAVLRALWAGGVRHFDAASLAEVELVRRLFPAAHIAFMHPVKSRRAIREAYHVHGVRDFSLDSMDELAKIMTETGNARDLGLLVRLGLPKGGAVFDLSGKFGADMADAIPLLQACRQAAQRLGVCFHVGSQCLEPRWWLRALALTGHVVEQAKVALDILDVGGGFPVSYPDETPPPLEDYMDAIAYGVTALNLPAHCRLWCEPGRALVAPGQSVVVQVMARKDDRLYINDGAYGSLSDAGVAVGLRFPVRLVRADYAPCSPELQAFEFFGPTCDSADRMKGPFLLPADVREGDWIEIGQLGAYGGTLRTAFNGFDRAFLVEVRDQPLLETPGYDLPEETIRAA